MTVRLHPLQEIDHEVDGGDVGERRFERRIPGRRAGRQVADEGPLGVEGDDADLAVPPRLAPASLNQNPFFRLSFGCRAVADSAVGCYNRNMSTPRRNPSVLRLNPALVAVLGRRRVASGCGHGWFWGVFARLVPAAVFKTVECSRERTLVGSIPIRSRQRGGPVGAVQDVARLLLAGPRGLAAPRLSRGETRTLTKHPARA
jgi:hypothetical protein